MYSATFAMTIIIGIAAINLLLGFATAILLGRGPKNWSDIDRAVVLHPISLRDLRPARRPTVERADVQLPAMPTLQESTLVESVAQAEHDGQGAATENNSTRTGNSANSAATNSAAASSAGPSDANHPSPMKIVLAPKSPVIEDEFIPPEKSLSQQLETWHQGDLSDETPSLSGMQIDVEGSDVDDGTPNLLADAVYKRIKAQVRKDRRVLRISNSQFAWFSSDVPPDDALMPVERIRQMLAKTQFSHQGNPIVATIVAGVVIGLPEDDADGLLKRLDAALQYVREKREHATCLDTGDGPAGVEAYAVEVEESECEL